jgi:hypothetical protein
MRTEFSRERGGSSHHGGADLRVAVRWEFVDGSDDRERRDRLAGLAENRCGEGARADLVLAVFDGIAARDRARDLDFRAGVVRVYRSAKREGEGPTKGKRFRSVQVGPELLGTLRDLRARSAETRATDLTHAPVFTMPIRRRKAEPGRWRSRAEYAPVDRNTVSRDWHKHALATAGLRNMPLHALRHTAAASWLLTGHALIYVQRQLGHASITTTESFYGT